MKLTNPVVVYTTAIDVEAYEVAELLTVAGIQSQVIEDQTPLEGLNPPTHATQVWVASDDLPQATEIARGFETRAQQRQLSHVVTVDLQSEWIDTRCDRCGTVTRFAPLEKGTVVNCPNCFSFMDVGDESEFDDWNVIEHEDSGSEDTGSEETP